MDEINKNFEVVIYQLSEKFNNIASKGRARIFYRGKNRNGTYITESFAEKLISTVPYTPVKGIWDNELKDFLDHGRARTQGKIYGVVLENPNFAWEDFEDDDGVIRTYACVDVIVYTEIYEEAKEIVGKALSMEILPSTIRGSWVLRDGEKVFEFTDGAFAGLQVLGDAVEPCFEGAQFFTLFNQLQELYARIKDFNLKSGGKVEMPTINFRLSDSQKFDALWTALNPEFNEENNWTCSAAICDVYDDYAVCFDYDTQEYFRQYYTKNEDSIELGAKRKCFMMDVTEDEYEALNSIKKIRQCSFNQLEELIGSLENDKAQYAASIEEKDNIIAERDTSIEEYTKTNSELSEQLSEANSNLEEITSSYNALQSEYESLKDYKYNTEKTEKQSMINKYAAKLDEDIIDNFTANIDNYSLEQLEKDLSFELVKATPSIFSLEVNPVIPKDIHVTGIAAILEKYK